jgi:hypothetical protein
MTDQTRTSAPELPAAAEAAGRRRFRLRRPRPGAGLAAPALGLALGLLALGPGVGPGYLLSYDMVFVPHPQFNSAVLGTSGTLPRAVPSDAVTAALARALPADLVQKLVLLSIFVLACAGAARLLSGERLPARLAAGAVYAWNPFVAERLILGQWALLLGYAGLPWVLAAAAGPGGPGRRTWRLAVALVPAAVGGFAAMSVSGLIAGPAAALRRGSARDRLAAVASALAVLALLSLPWLVPALTRQVVTSPAGVAAFAARADTPFGTIGSLLMLGGGWNSQTVPAGYGGLASVPWLCLSLTALAGFVLFGRRRWPGLGTGAVLGFILAALGVVAAGQELLRSLIGWWPGFAVLRDAQQFAAPLALAEAAGAGLVVAAVLRLSRPELLREARAVLAAGLVVAPVLFLPGLAWGAAGRLRPVQYPASWLAARQIINADRQPGRVLLLPWGAYRRYGWNHDQAVLDPWPRLLARPVVWDDGVQVGSLQIPPEDPSAIAVSHAVTSGRPLTALLRAAGYRYVIVDGSAAPESPAEPDSQAAAPAPGAGRPALWFRARLAGCRVVYSGAGLVIYLVPAS